MWGTRIWLDFLVFALKALIGKHTILVFILLLNIRIFTFVFHMVSCNFLQNSCPKKLSLNNLWSLLQSIFSILRYLSWSISQIKSLMFQDRRRRKSNARSADMETQKEISDTVKSEWSSRFQVQRKKESKEVKPWITKLEAPISGQGTHQWMRHFCILSCKPVRVMITASFYIKFMELDQSLWWFIYTYLAASFANQCMSIS
jgi:hypothetical protein